VATHVETRTQVPVLDKKNLNTLRPWSDRIMIGDEFDLQAKVTLERSWGKILFSFS
jgi:hypothetical protein